jgi:hypothetical protein
MHLLASGCGLGLVDRLGEASDEDDLRPAAALRGDG